MSQYGGGRMGGVALAAGGSVSQTFRNMPKGPIERLYLTVSLGLKSSGSAFNAVVSTGASAAAEGIDDLDLLLNACFTSISFYFDPSSHAGILTPAQWRTILGLFNQRDLNGTFVNAVSVPISSGSATTFKIVIPLPISLARYFDDGAIFRNGSARLSQGQIDFQMPASLTPSVVLAAGTAVVSGLSVSLNAETGSGTENDIGMTWNAKRYVGLPTVYQFDPGLRLALLDVTPVATSAVTSWRVGSTELWEPAAFGAKYQSERLFAGGFDITARGTPLIWVEPDRKFLEFLGHIGKDPSVDAVSGVSSLTLYDVKAIPVPGSVVESVSMMVGGGGQVSVMHPSPPSMPAGTAVPDALQGLLPVRINPGNIPNIPGMTLTAKTPAAAGADTLRRTLTTNRAGSIFAMFGRR